jgi:antitoxin component HigA of HigAB toxin-antitoxin module
MVTIEHGKQFSDARHVTDDAPDLEGIIRAYLLHLKGSKTQTDFAKDCGIKQTTLSAVLRRERSLTVRQLMGLAAMQGFTAAELLIDMAAVAAKARASDEIIGVPGAKSPHSVMRQGDVTRPHRRKQQ